MYKQQAVLEKKVEAENNGLLKEKGLTLRPIMYRDYLVKLELLDANQVVCARFNCYYSPKKQSFTLTFEKLFDDSLKDLLKHIFQGTDLPFREERDIINEEVVEKEEQTKYQAYVDGSHIQSKTGYGAVILRWGIPIKRLYGQVDASDGLRQVSGELQGVQEVLKYCQEKEIPEIGIYYDYTGIREWAEDTWKANKTITKAYKAFMKKNTVKVRWFKVKAHSGNVFNEMADRLAKKGAKGETGSEV